MCLILLAIDQHPQFPLVVAANRDEYFDRPTAALDFWTDTPELLAGRDLRAGGTWMGITRSGRFAAVTNVREPDRTRPDARTRGNLTTEFLIAQAPTPAYLAALQSQDEAYNGYNLICGFPGQLMHYSNRTSSATPLGSGLHGVSNHLLDTPWPKVVDGKAALGELLQRPAFTLEDVLAVLNERTPAPDHALPHTGVSPTLERALSSRFIHAPDLAYGTRTSTVLRINNAGELDVKEWTWTLAGELAGIREFRLELSL